MSEKNSKEELLRIIKENPNLPVVFFAQNDDFCPDYGSTVFERFYCNVSMIYIVEDCNGNTYYDDLDEVIEIISDNLCDDEQYEKLSDEDFEKAVKKYIEENIEHYKAIVISLYH